VTKARFATLGILPFVFASAHLNAQQASPPVATDSLKAQWIIQLPPGYLNVALQPRILPAMNSSTPSGYSPEWGDVYAGVGYQRHTRPYQGSRNVNREDGLAVVGLGIGKARAVALEVEYASFSTVRSKLFSVGGLPFHLSHPFPTAWGVAAGAYKAATAPAIARLRVSDDGRVRIDIGDAPAWELDTKWFDGRPVLRVQSRPDAPRYLAEDYAEDVLDRIANRCRRCEEARRRTMKGRSAAQPTNDLCDIRAEDP